MHVSGHINLEKNNTYSRILTDISVPEIQIDILVEVLKVQKRLRQSGLGGTDWDFETSS